MKQECVDLVSKALGRKISSSQGDEILAAMRARLSSMRRYDPEGWEEKTHDERVRAAAKDIAEYIVRRAEKKKENTLKNAIRQDANLREMERLARDEDIHGYAAVAKILRDVEARTHGVTNEYLVSMLDTLNGIGSKFLGLVEDKADVEAFVREAYGEKTGNERARAAWLAFDETSEKLRLRANEAGADIGKLDYNYLLQSHDWWKLKRAGKEKWIEDIYPLLDRDRMVGNDGEPLSSGDLQQLLGASFDNIVSTGNPESNLFEMAENLPSMFAKRAAAKKSPHRGLHFKDADSYLAYERAYGKGSLSGALIGHVSGMARDIAIMETMGPTPLATFTLLKNVAESVSQNARLTEKSSWRLLAKYSDHQGIMGVSVDAMWNVLNGSANRAAVNHEGVAGFMSGWRNLEMAGKLGKAFISSFSDIPSYFIATNFNRLPFWQGAKFWVAAYGSDWKDFATRAGIIADSLASDFNRWGSDNIGQGWTAKMANATMKASFLNAFTDATRRAFSLNMMAGLAKMAKRDWAGLDDYDRARLLNAGISERDWGLFHAATPDVHKGIEFLTAPCLKSLRENCPKGYSLSEVEELPSKLLAFIVQEGEMASLNPDLTTRAETTGGLQRGTLDGELRRSLFLFKSFPISMMEKHYRRAAWLARHGSRMDQLQYAAGLTVATTIFGAISLQVQNVLNGKDTQDMTSGQFWFGAMAKGGGLGFIGDYLANGLSEDARYGAMSGLTNFAGPMVGTVVQASDVLTAAAGSAIYDKKTKPAAKALNLVRSHTPFINMWYTSAAIDRAVLNEINEYLSPGYIKRSESRLRRGTGQEFWWRPDELTPSRAPRMADQPRR